MAVSRAIPDIQSDLAVRLIVLRSGKSSGSGTDPELLEHALSMAPLGRIALDALTRSPYGGGPGGRSDGNVLWAAPPEWRGPLSGRTVGNVSGAGVLVVDPKTLHAATSHSWLVVSDGRFVTKMSRRRLAQELSGTTADVLAVMADPELAAYRERVRLTQEGRLVGYRRLYRDSAEPIPMPFDWPHHLFIRGSAAAALLKEGLPVDFRAFVERLRSAGVSVRAFVVAGSAIDLTTQAGWLSLAATALEGTWRSASRGSIVEDKSRTAVEGGVSAQARLIGPVLLGDHVCIEPQAVVIGPSILCDRSTVRSGAVVDRSILDAGVEVGRDQVVRRTVFTARESAATRRSVAGYQRRQPEYTDAQETVAFRDWPGFSYPGVVKRAADVVVALIVLILFAPIIPFIALAVRINSPGPTFFRDKRQGRHGKSFFCIKFRTMREGADKLQDKLRFISEVDGPQFKMTDDPRITTVGRFLRETYLDEIPQFYNVLVGDMSVVGPRPSPESENTLCPWWRDARLSVRPGITGLWQVCRTREPMKDFQEWIHYDTRYVRELSWRTDLWICWRTFRRMVVNFISQF